VIIFLAGCGPRYPMGLSQAAWEALPKSEQERLAQEQYELNLQEAKEEAREEAIEEQKMAREERDERRRIDDMHQNPRYGDLVNVAIVSGELKNTRMNYHPVMKTSVVVAKGETRTLSVPLSQSEPRDIYINYASDGSKVTIYLDENDGRGINLINNGGWSYGSYYYGETLRLGAYTAIRNATFWVRYFMPY